MDDCTMPWWTLIKLIECSGGGRCSRCFWSMSRVLTGIYIIFDVAPLQYRSLFRDHVTVFLLKEALPLNASAG